MKLKTLFILLLLTTPGIWQVLSHTPDLISEWRSLPQNISHSLASKSTSDYMTHIYELRWGGRSLHRDNLFSRLIYNQPLFYANEFFELVQFATPKLYFLAGDGSQFSPRRIEPISILLFPFWIAGVVYLFTNNKYKFGLGYLFFLSVAYLSGRKNLAILFPILILNVYISSLGLKKYARLAKLVLVYGIYITLMNVWLNAS